MNNTEVIRRNEVYRGCYTLMKDWATWSILKRQSEQHIRWRDRGRKADWSYKVKDSWNIARKLWKSYLCFVTQACKTRYSEGCRNITSLKTACSSKWVQEQPEQGRKTLSQHTKLKIKYKKGALSRWYNTFQACKRLAVEPLGPDTKNRIERKKDASKFWKALLK